LSDDRRLLIGLLGGATAFVVALSVGIVLEVYANPRTMTCTVIAKSTGTEEMGPHLLTAECGDLYVGPPWPFADNDDEALWPNILPDRTYRFQVRGGALPYLSKPFVDEVEFVARSGA
jgi:hypothetical protein